MKLVVKEQEQLIRDDSPETEEDSSERWLQISKLVDESSSSPLTPPPRSPPITTLDLKDKLMYGVRPLEQMSQSIIKCKYCNKPVLEHAMESHIVNCQLVREKQKKRKEAASILSAEQSARKRGVSEVSDTNPSPPKKSATSFTLTHNKSANVITAPAMQKKDSNKVTEIDTDVNCGVALEKGLRCSRSLTCKTHSMGAKRAVPRSLPYDTLLINWQKTQKEEAALNNGNGPNRKLLQSKNGINGVNGVGGINGSGTGSGRKRRKSEGGNGIIGAGGSSNSNKEGRNGERRIVRDKGKTMFVVGEWEEEEEDLNNPIEGMMIDSDEEVEKVMQVLQSRNLLVKPLNILGMGNNSRSAFTLRNTKLARLKAVNGVFGKL